MFLLEDTVPIEPRVMLIPEKITIPTTLPRPSRPRLLALLENSLASRAATVVSGRAGTGKTALATSFAYCCGRTVAWYKVDASDFDLRVFSRYLVSSVAHQRPGFGEQTLMSPEDPTLMTFVHPSERGASALAEWFVHELLESEGGPLVIVLEDLHLICESDWLVPFLCRLLALLPRNVHLLITSRTMPPAPLWRMRSKQMLDVIDEATLAFTCAEAVELFETYGLAREQACIARDHARGRAAALIACVETLDQSGAKQ